MKKQEKLFKIIEAISRITVANKLKEIAKIDTVELTLNEYKYLEIIDTLENSTFTEIANELGYSKPAVTAIVNKLIKKDLIYKKQSENDKRVFNIYFSIEGKKIFSAYKKAHMAYVKHVHKTLSSAEFDMLLELLGKTV